MTISQYPLPSTTPNIGGVNYDPVGKLRVSTPQALIDTDFEYGTQPTKWESIGLQNNRQSAYYIAQSPLTVTSITGDNSASTRLVTVVGTFTVPAGPIFIQNTLNSNANGWFYTAGGTNTLTFIAPGLVPNTNQFNPALTYVYAGYFYSNCGISVGANTITSNGATPPTYTVTTSTPHGLSAGSYVYMVGATSFLTGTGFFTTTTLTPQSTPSPGVVGVGYSVSGPNVTAGTSVTAVNNATFSGSYDGGGTLTYLSGTVPTIGMYLTGTGIPANTYINGGSNPSFTYTPTTASGTIATTGLSYTVTPSQSGANGALTYSSALPANAPNGAWIVVSTPTANTFTFTTSTSHSVPNTLGLTAGTASLYARPAGYVETRAFDGGVAFTSGAVVPNQQLIRQTRRYFRYQSGKSIQFSTGTSLKPSIFNTSITSSGTTVTVTTVYPHNLAAGCVITVTGADQAAYNGTFTVVSAPTTVTLTYTALTTPSASPATGVIIKISPVSWYGSSNRVGFFDLQNGMYFEYDGQILYAVLRSSIYQINGNVAVTQGSTLVTGTSTQFSTQLTPGDFIVIRGQSYRVLSISSDTVLNVSPEYRGTTLTNCIVSKTIESRTPQSQWADPCDGTGPSAYNLDLTKMQMFYIDYSWYGAGIIRFGFRATNGTIIYAHTIQNNNIKYEAFMRSGNMASHYESSGVTPFTVLTSTLDSSVTTGGVINVQSTANFAPSGVVRVSAPGNTGVVEHISYSAKTATTLVIASRAQTGGQATAQTFTYSASAPIALDYASPDTAPSLSHWGSSVIMDGQFNDDKSLIFNYGTTAAITTTTTSAIPILAIRIAPAVDNGQIGLLGAKEIINRMQLQFLELGLFTTGTTGYLINLVLNGFVTGAGFSSFTTPATTGNITSSLAQVASNTTTTVSISGGESVAAAYTNASGQTTLDLTPVRDLGNSILDGGTSDNVPTSQAGLYPDGPDILYVVAIPLATTSASLRARISWKEAQA